MKISTFTKPFRYFVIEDFLPIDQYLSLKEASLTSVNWESNSDYPDHFGMITSPDVLRTMIGKEMRELISSQFEKNVKRNSYSVPQLRCTRGRTTGVAMHTDSECGFNVASFLHLTDWQPDMGGDLQIWSSEDAKFSLANTIQPKGNTLVVLGFSETSYHSVTPVIKDLTRMTLISEWCFV